MGFSFALLTLTRFIHNKFIRNGYMDLLISAYQGFIIGLILKMSKFAYLIFEYCFFDYLFMKV